MFRKMRFSYWLAGAVILAAVEFACVVAIEVAATSTAQAQFNDNRYQYRRHRSGGFFQQLFGPFNAPRYGREYEQAPQPVDHSRAPNPPKRDKDVTPTTTILVMGDGMADWLAYGLEEAFSESPDIAVVRENRRDSGLIRYDRKSDIDWWHHAREYLAKNRADYVVMMLGIHDRESIRERDVIAQARKEAEARKKQAEEAVQRALENAPGGATAGETGKQDDADRQTAAIAASGGSTSNKLLLATV